MEDRMIEHLSSFTINSLEILAACILLYLIDKSNRLKVYQYAILVCLLSFTTVLFDIYGIPYYIVINTILFLLLVYLMTRKPIIDLVSDVLLSFVILILFQYAITVFITHIGINIKEDEYVLYIALIIIIAVFFLPTKSLKVDRSIELIYRKHRKLTVWILLNIFFLAVIIINLLNLDEKTFWENSMALLFIIMLYSVMNIVVIISLLFFQREKSNRERIEEYGKHLENDNSFLRAKDHEHRNHLNIISGIVEQYGNEEVFEMTDRFIQGIYESKEIKKNKTMLSSNSIVVSFLFSRKRDAEKSDIEFDYYIEEPFPEYPISENNLMIVLSNLISNAFEEVSEIDGARIVNLSMERNSIRIHNSLSNKFDKEIIPKMAGAGISTKGDNHGFGLYNVHRIIRKSNGKINTYEKGGIIYTEIKF